jgi:hypothetical protein
MATITSEKGITRRWAGVAVAAFTDLNTDLLRTFRTPTDFEIDAGIKTKTTEGSNNLGEKSLLDRYVDSVMPELTLTIAGSSTEIFGYQIGKEVVKITGSSEILTFRKQALQGQTLPVPIGGYGYDIAIDAVSRGGARLGGDLSVGLTQQPWATFVPATLLSFAVGANGAFKFSNDLVTSRAYITVRVPAIVDVYSLSENNIGFMSADVVLRSSDDSVSRIFVPTFQINPEGAKIQAASDNTQIKGSIVTSGCVGYTIKDFARALTC